MRWDILQEHLDEASFLWTQRERVLVAPHYALRDVAALEERLWAHLDALVLGGTPVVERLLRPALESDEPERVAVAALCLLAEENEPTLSSLAEWLPEEGECIAPPIQRALELCERPELPARLGALLEGRATGVQRALVEVLAFQRAEPGAGILESLWESNEPLSQAVALRAAARIPVPLAPGLLKQALNSSHPAVRDSALEAGLVLGIREAWSACQVLARKLEPESALARLLCAMGGKPDGEDWMEKALQVPELREEALWAAGFSGRLRLADACLPLMEEESLAPLAGEAFSAITGLVLEGEFVAPRPEPPEELPPLEEDLDADLRVRPEDMLPMPAPLAIARWWAKVRPGLDPRLRYLRGQPFSLERLVAELEHGPMRRRAVLALELAIRSRGEHWVPVRALTGRQLRILEHIQARPLASRGGAFSW